jgi:hypothetical protein
MFYAVVRNDVIQELSVVQCSLCAGVPIRAVFLKFIELQTLR